MADSVRKRTRRGFPGAVPWAVLLGALLAPSPSRAAGGDPGIEAAFAAGAGGDPSLRLEIARTGRTSVLSGAPAGGGPGMSLACALCSRDELLAEARALGALLAAAPSGGPSALEIAGLPPGARVTVDGVPARSGGRPQPLEPGRHEVRAVGPGGPRAKRVDLGEGESAMIAFDDMRAARAEPRPLRAAIAVTGAGAALAAAGTALLLMDGECATTRVDPAGRCERIHSLAPLGWSVAGAGAAAFVLGVVWGALAWRAERSVAPDPGGAP